MKDGSDMSPEKEECQRGGNRSEWVDGDDCRPSLTTLQGGPRQSEQAW
jgi:hypothetical protein